VEEIEYHVYMMHMMGYTDGWHPNGAAINIHVGSKGGGIHGFLSGFRSLGVDSKNLLTVENDEIGFGLDTLEPLAEHVAIVLDIHHEWVYSKGHHIMPDDKRIDFVKESWRGVRPLGHYSVSSNKLMPNQSELELPDFEQLRSLGFTLRDIRAHSEGCWNVAANDWAISHLSWMDIEVEAKLRNLASQQLFNRVKKLAK
jgi:hypothetical protein